MKRKPKLTVIPNDPMPEKVVNLRPKRKVSDAVLMQSRIKPNTQRNNPFQLPSFPKISLPHGNKRTQPMAMDEALIEINAWAVQNTYNGVFSNGATFLGYPYLSELSQIPEYRKITETIAMHMTRKWITLKSSGAKDGDSKAQKIKEITDDIENFKVRDVFRKAAEVDGYFGRAHLYIDLGYKTPLEMKMPIGNGRDALSQIKVEKGSLQGFKIIEPVWTYPSNYNSNNPFTGDWYNPQSWFVLGKEVHGSRLLRMVGREVSDLLKPAYAFGGLALSQIAKPYIDNWLRTRQSVADVVWAFSTSGVMTDLQTLMQGHGEDLFARAELYNNLRNNRGLMLLNKDSEEFFQINTPLGTLDKLQAQAQEHMASVSSIPLVFLLGITPSGLNASSEGEIRAFYDFIHAFQMKFFSEPLTRVIDFIQLNRYGVIDPEIVFEFEPLWSMDEKAQAEVDKTKAETDDLRINGGVISPLEARKAVANSSDNPYPGLDVTVLPVPPGGGDSGEDPEDPEGGGGEIGGKGLDPGEVQGDDEHPRIGGGSDDDNSPFAHDEWSENDHKRGQPGNAGQFGSGGGSSSKPKVVEHFGSYAVEHNGEHVKNKAGNRKLFESPKAAQKFADTYTGEQQAAEPKEKKPPSKSTISKGDKFKQVATIKEYLDIAKKSERDLSAEDKEAISHYTSPEYDALNKALRSGNDLSPETQKIVDNLDRIISESKLSEPVTLFRGLKGGKVREQLDAMLPGDVMTDPGFVSTSMAKHVAGAQSHGAQQKATMIIRAPGGASAAFPGEHSYNATPGEGGKKVDTAMEAILPRGSQFKLIGKHGATYEVELVPATQAQDDANWQESQHPRAQNGQFGSGGGGASPSGASGESVKALNKVLGKPAGISGKYRQGLQDMLKDPGLNDEMKLKVKHKIVESYTAKKTQLLNAPGSDPDMISSIQKKINKLSASLGVKPAPVQTPEPAKPAASNTPKHTIDKSHSQPDKFIVKTPDGKVIGNSGEPGENVPTKKFDTQAEAEAFAKQLDANPPKPAASKPTPAAPQSVPAPHHSYVNTAKQRLEKAGLTGTLTPTEGAAIIAYSQSEYGDLNKEMRAGAMSKSQWQFAKDLNKALDKLPKHVGVTNRGAQLSPSQLALYKPGMVIEERAFTSTSKKKGFDGNTRYEIHGHSGRDISKLSSHQGEAEVLFKSGARFEVKEIKGNTIVLHEVDYE